MEKLLSSQDTKVSSSFVAIGVISAITIVALGLAVQLLLRGSLDKTNPPQTHLANPTIASTPVVAIDSIDSPTASRPTEGATIASAFPEFSESKIYLPVISRVGCQTVSSSKIVAYRGPSVYNDWYVFDMPNGHPFTPLTRTEDTQWIYGSMKAIGWFSATFLENDPANSQNRIVNVKAGLNLREEGRMDSAIISTVKVGTFVPHNDNSDAPWVLGNVYAEGWLPASQVQCDLGIIERLEVEWNLLATPTNTPTVAPTSTPVPSLTPTPTATPIPTSTWTPEPTPTFTPTPSAELCTPPTVYFDEAYITASMRVVLKNCSPTPLRIFGWRNTGNNPPEFYTIFVSPEEGDALEFPIEYGPNEEIPVCIFFGPRANGVFSAILEIYSDGIQREKEINLKGIGKFPEPEPERNCSYHNGQLICDSGSGHTASLGPYDADCNRLLR